MGMLSSHRDTRANRRAHASALKSRAKLEAKLAAKETRAKARDVHELAVTSAKDTAKDTAEQARESARSASRSTRTSAKSANRKAIKATSRADKAARKVAARLSAREEKDRTMSVRDEKNREAELARRNKEAGKIDKIGRKHEKQMAKIELAKIDAGKFGQKDVKRWIDIAKAAAPVLAPLVYKAVTAQQDRSSGFTRGTAGPASALASRIQSLEASVGRLESSRGSDAQVTDFVASARKRLTDLSAAVDSAETMPTAQRREVHASISKELDRVNRDVLARLGVRA